MFLVAILSFMHCLQKVFNRPLLLSSHESFPDGQENFGFTAKQMLRCVLSPLSTECYQHLLVLSVSFTRRVPAKDKFPS